MKKRRVIYSACLLAAFSAYPLLAEDELMTRLYFNQWLQNSASPLEARINNLKATIAQLEQTARELKSRLTTEIKVTIGQKEALVDGAIRRLDVAPLIVDGRILVPVRFIGEAFGASFTWEEKTRRVTFTLDDLRIELYVGKKTARVNGREITLDAAPAIEQGRTLVPLRFIGESLGASFEWDSRRQTATIYR